MITALGIAALAALFHRILALDVEHIAERERACGHWDPEGAWEP